MSQTQIWHKHKYVANTYFPSKFEVLSAFVTVLCVSTEEISFSNSCWLIMARSRNMQQEITLDKARNIFMIDCLLIFRRLLRVILYLRFGVIELSDILLLFMSLVGISLSTYRDRYTVPETSLATHQRRATSQKSEHQNTVLLQYRVCFWRGITDYI